jgi:hypothetical protein
VRRVLLPQAVLLWLFLACSDLTAPRPESSDPLRPGAAGAGATLLQVEDEITWSDTRPLTWDDFTGTPDPDSPRDAVTTSGVVGTFKCDTTGFSFDVKAVFSKSQSWVEAGKQTAALLAHEQGHFDISEVFARKARKELSELKDPCKDNGDRAQAILDRIAKEENAEQDKYDKATDHGTDPKKQQQWQDKIKKDLEKLSGFK